MALVRYTSTAVPTARNGEAQGDKAERWDREANGTTIASSLALWGSPLRDSRSHHRHLEDDQFLAGEVPDINRKYTASCCRYRLMK